MFVFTPPELASNLRPLSVKPSAVFFKSDTLTALLGLFVLAASSLSRNVAPVWLEIELATLFRRIGAVVELLPSFMDAITSDFATKLP